MSLVCAQCSRVNPAEAAYCYHDGAALAGRATGPINAGSAPFPNQFVFPNGTACRNFDQLAMACQQNWPAAIDLLKQGFLGSFFGGLGRVDLAMAAQEAAKFPDTDRGLDQLLTKLPTQALQEPKLQAEPSEINLGQIKIGQDRATELHLTNLGMRLLYGNVTSDCKWLTIGETPGQPEKIFQFGTEAILPLQIRGQHLRAGSKPIEGHLTVDSNGGTMTVTVKADVPITPFPGGPFDGATTPRKIAEIAKANPKDTASYFEGGAVAKWYANNGWAYPVQGPIMSGMGAIQQFFEALGVAKAPKVDFPVKSLELLGNVGETVQTSVEVTTTERKVVYGWATCDQSWVEIGKTKLAGKTATIPITVRIPSPAPPTLEVKLNVIANGNQKMVVPLKINVAGGKKGVKLEEPEEFAPVEILDESSVPVVMEIAEKQPKTAPKPPLPPVSAPPPAYSPPPAPASGDPFAFSEEPARAGAAESNPFAVTDDAATSSAPSVVTASSQSGSTKESAGISLIIRLAMMLVPVALLGLCLLLLIVRDVFWGPTASATDKTKVIGAAEVEDFGNVDKDNPHVLLRFDEGKLGKDSADSMTFAVHKIDPKDKGAAPIKLNYYVNGLGNSVVARINGKDSTFGGGQLQGKWTPFESKEAGKYGGKSRTWEFANSIFITQTVTIEPGEPVPGDKEGEFKRPLNVCLARYKIENRNKKFSQKVGMRVILDTYIGDRDDVPFNIPGTNELITTFKDLHDKDVPDFVQVLQKPDLKDPGIVVHLGLRISDAIEPPKRFLLTRYPVTVTNDKKSLDKWEVATVPFGDDSSVVMYWEEKELKPNTSRELGFTYGLGTVSSLASSGKLGVTVGGTMQKGKELTIVGLVTDPKATQATLRLPGGLELMEDSKPLVQPIPPSRPGPDGVLRPVPVTWRVRAKATGPQDINVSTDSGLTQGRRLSITTKSIFN